MAEKSDNARSGAKISDQEFKERQKRYNREYYLRVVKPARKGLPVTLLDTPTTLNNGEEVSVARLEDRGRKLYSFQGRYHNLPYNLFTRLCRLSQKWKTLVANFYDTTHSAASPLLPTTAPMASGGGGGADRHHATAQRSGDDDHSVCQDGRCAAYTASIIPPTPPLPQPRRLLFDNATTSATGGATAAPSNDDPFVQMSTTVGYVAAARKHLEVSVTLILFHAILHIAISLTQFHS